MRQYSRTEKDEIHGIQTLKNENLIETVEWIAIQLWLSEPTGNAIQPAQTLDTSRRDITSRHYAISRPDSEEPAVS